MIRVLLLILVAAVASFGADRATLSVNVPFEFMVGAKTMPAGEYYVVEGTGSQTIRLRSADAKTSAMVLTVGTQRNSAQDDASLAFRMVEGRQVLTTVSRSGEDISIAGRGAGHGAVLAVIRAVAIR